ncbi:uncharacterized protein LOC143482023 isoform X2 [Brachyhypopomus gauderio]|uniref:uncharacterized protein LOC143482023 isoform X2 n=1 Tax=Brachyhypopomus gauderio TaxID=698409 RepID=UPI004041D688
MANKDALVRYVSLFPDVTRAVRERRARDEPSSSGQEGQCLVGFGVHQSVSYRDLYQAQDREKRSYVQWIRQQKVRPGTKMEVLQKPARGLEADAAQRAASVGQLGSLHQRPVWEAGAD